MPLNMDRRRCLTLAATSVALTAAPWSHAARGAEEKEPEVAAVEDLMREHGILRRALLVYAEAASRLARGSGQVSPDALARTAALFRSFGEDYHERSLEEKHVFVPLARAGGRNATLVKTLTAQHERGRQITDYVMKVANQGRLAANASALSGVLTGFVRMYEHHAAIEDTLVFPAWKRAITPARYGELSEEFEELEHKMFGKDGFEDALERIADIEQAFGLSDLAALTVPAPPEPAA
jgi:hemerythrin-like domain-containing protein